MTMRHRCVADLMTKPVLRKETAQPDPAGLLPDPPAPPADRAKAHATTAEA